LIKLFKNCEQINADEFKIIRNKNQIKLETEVETFELVTRLEKKLIRIEHENTSSFEIVHIQKPKLNKMKTFKSVAKDDVNISPK
jgi:hypothetical protein